MHKLLLRKKFRILRANADINSTKIIQNLKLFLDTQNYTKIALYYPINNEINILEILPLLKTTKQILLPKIHDREIKFYHWNQDLKALILNPTLNILEPKATTEVIPEIIITPLLAFDQNLYRLGYGGGYYDRYFAKYPNTKKIGIAANIQKYAELLPRETHDIKLDYIITETNSFTA